MQETSEKRETHMYVKSILEVAFEWICECGAFEQLRKQCENYTLDLMVGFRRGNSVLMMFSRNNLGSNWTHLIFV